MGRARTRDRSLGNAPRLASFELDASSPGGEYTSEERGIVVNDALFCFLDRRGYLEVVRFVPRQYMGYQRRHG